MLIFDESKMKKAMANQRFILEDDDLGVMIVSSDSEEPATVNKCEEVWILDLKHSNEEYLFVYFPKIDYATCVFSDLLEIE